MHEIVVRTAPSRDLSLCGIPVLFHKCRPKPVKNQEVSNKVRPRAGKTHS